MQKTWVLVADAARARIFATDRWLHRFEELTSYIHIPSRLRETDVYTDGRGRQAVAGDYSRVGAAPARTDLHSREAESFAREVGLNLERAAHDGSFDALVVVAPPGFLGALRHAMSGEVTTRVTHTIAKDYSRYAAHELHPILRKKIGASHAA